MALDLSKDYALELSNATNKEATALVANNYIDYLKTLPEIQNMTSEIKFNDLSSVVNFGTKPSIELGKISDRLLNLTKDVSKKEMLEVFSPLANILKRFDIEEFKEEKKQGFLKSLFKKVENNIDAMLKKYDNIGNELSDVVQTLNKYKVDIVASNKTIEELQQANIQYFDELEKYIASSELALEEAKELKKHFENMTNANEMEKAENLEKANLLIEGIEKKAYELRTVQNVALQSIPTLNIMRRNNFNLAQQVDSKILTTIPIFKNALVQAVVLKRQRIQQKNLAEIDAITNEMLLKNAQNTKDLSAALNSGNDGIKLETLQQTFELLKNTVTETEAMLQNNKIERENNTKALEEMKKQMIETNFFKNQ